MGSLFSSPPRADAGPAPEVKPPTVMPDPDKEQLDKEEFRKLSENFELCVTGLGFVRSDLDRMQDPACRRVKDLLLN